MVNKYRHEKVFAKISTFSRLKNRNYKKEMAEKSTTDRVVKLNVPQNKPQNNIDLIQEDVIKDPNIEKNGTQLELGKTSAQSKRPAV